MIAVIDTNCLLASIPPKGNYYWLYLAFKEERFQWLISNEIMTEYEERLVSRYSEKIANIVLYALSVAPNVVFDEPYFKWNLLKKMPMIINSWI
jgi:predicted nucleic acid-binding protein